VAVDAAGAVLEAGATALSMGVVYAATEAVLVAGGV